MRASVVVALVLALTVSGCIAPKSSCNQSTLMVEGFQLDLDKATPLVSETIGEPVGFGPLESMPDDANHLMWIRYDDGEHAVLIAPYLPWASDATHVIVDLHGPPEPIDDTLARLDRVHDALRIWSDEDHALLKQNLETVAESPEMVRMEGSLASVRLDDAWDNIRLSESHETDSLSENIVVRDGEWSWVFARELWVQEWTSDEKLRRAIGDDGIHRWPTRSVILIADEEGNGWLMFHADTPQSADAVDGYMEAWSTANGYPVVYGWEEAAGCNLMGADGMKGSAPFEWSGK